MHEALARGWGGTWMPWCDEVRLETVDLEDRLDSCAGEASLWPYRPSHSQHGRQNPSKKPLIISDVDQPSRPGLNRTFTDIST